MSLAESTEGGAASRDGKNLCLRLFTTFLRLNFMPSLWLEEEVEDGAEAAPDDDDDEAVGVVDKSSGGESAGVTFEEAEEVASAAVGAGPAVTVAGDEAAGVSESKSPIAWAERQKNKK